MLIWTGFCLLRELPEWLRLWRDGVCAILYSFSPDYNQVYKLRKHNTSTSTSHVFAQECYMPEGIFYLYRNWGGNRTDSKTFIWMPWKFIEFRGCSYHLENASSLYINGMKLTFHNVYTLISDMHMLKIKIIKGLVLFFFFLFRYSLRTTNSVEHCRNV